jgi:hypothetical protein
VLNIIKIEEVIIFKVDLLKIKEAIIRYVIAGAACSNWGERLDPAIKATVWNSGVSINNRKIAIGVNFGKKNANNPHAYTEVINSQDKVPDNPSKRRAKEKKTVVQACFTPKFQAI